MTKCGQQIPFSFTLSYAIWTAGQRINPLAQTPFVWKIFSNISIDLTYTNWKPGQPDFAAGTECCISMDPPDFVWEDTACGNPAATYMYDSFHCVLCEIDMM